jgi:hypothetical protein
VPSVHEVQPKEALIYSPHNPPRHSTEDGEMWNNPWPDFGAVAAMMQTSFFDDE